MSTAWPPDPLFTAVCALACTGILAYDALGKAREPERFEGTVRDYQVLPAPLVSPFARLFPLVEGAAAALLPWAATRVLGVALLIVLVTLMGCAVGVNLLRGRTHISCGCGDAPTPLSPAVLWRLGVLAALGGFSALTPQPRLLGLPDAAVIAAGALFLLVAWPTTAQLQSNHPLLLSLRGDLR